MSDAAHSLRQAMALHQAGRLGDAAAQYQAVLRRSPKHADARHLLGLALHQQGESRAALPHIQQAIAVNATAPIYHNSLGVALRAVGQVSAAIQAFRRAADLRPSYTDAWVNLVETLQQLREDDDVGAALQAWVEQSGGAAEALEQRAAFRYAQGDLRGAIADHTHVGQLRPNDWAPLIRLAVLAHETGDDALALQAWGDAHARRARDGTLASATTRSKLDHDHEQIGWLMAEGLLPDDWSSALHAVQEVRDELFSGEAEAHACPTLSAAQRERLEPWTQRPAHIRACPARPDGALSPAWGAGAVEARFQAQSPGVTWVDGLLTPEALHDLQRFCQESMIWREYRYNGGYVGSTPEHGFHNGLLLQIARELRERLPDLLADHPLRQMWAFKYDQQRTGIGVHADSAAINVNFCITPDEANLDPASGGLRVWRKRAPDDWDFDAFNRQPARLLAWLEGAGAEEVLVPYRANRAVLFDSDLVHCTDDFSFAPGYANRRINITMLFGARKK